METNLYYEVRKPKSMVEGKKYPVLFALHGIGYNEEAMLDIFEGAKDECILIGVRGHLPHNDGYAYYYLKGYGNPVREQFDESLERLGNFIESACNTYPIDTDRIYIGGFSQGAILSNSLSIVLGEKVKGIVSLNGYVPSFVVDEHPTYSLQHLNVFLSDGEFDTIFPPEIGKRNVEFFQKAGAAVTCKTYQTGHEIGIENKNDITNWLLSETRQN